MDTVKNTLDQLGATEIKVSDLRRYGSTPRIHFVLPFEQAIKDIAKLDGVSWIEEVPEYDEDNSNTARTMQSGTLGTTPVWDVGIHGGRANNFCHGILCRRYQSLHV